MSLLFTSSVLDFMTHRPIDPLAHTPTDESESALHGIKLYVNQYSDAVTDILRSAGVYVIPSPTCSKVLHTSFRGSLKELLQQVPALSDYTIKQYKWWQRLADSIKRD